MIGPIVFAMLVAAPSPAPLASASAPPARATAFAQLAPADAEQLALANSPDVASARAHVDEAAAALAAARAAFAPALVSNYAQVPQGNPPGPNIVSRQLTTGLQVTIGDLVSYAPAVREAAFALASAQADERAGEATERVKVVGLYYDALKARALAEARRSARDAANAQLAAARLRYGAGDAPRLDVVRADVAAAKALADLELATATDASATEALGVETGVAPATLAQTAASPEPAARAGLDDPAQAVALARAQRPEIVSAKRSADAARAAVGSARAAGFPALTVSGGYLVGTDSGVPINAPSVNAQLTLPLSGATRQKVAAANARVVQADAKAAAVERQIVLDVAASARALGAAERAADATSRARASADDELRATELGYRNGASSSLEVTSARATAVQALVDDLGARYDLAKARAVLAVETGP